jgi:hypothetical protein
MTLSRLGILVIALAFVLPAPAEREAKAASHPLREVKVVQLESTVVSNPAKVKEDYAADMLRDNLKRALQSAGFEIGDSPVKVHLVLDEFTSGSTAERFLVGFGAGRSAVDTRLVVSDGEKEAATVHIKVRGNLALSPYEGGNTQRREAVNSFEQRLLEELYKLK